MLIGIFDPMGVQTDRLRCEVCQNLILSPMNTGLLRYAVATAPTVYGNETLSFLFIVFSSLNSCNSTYRLRYWNPKMSKKRTFAKGCNSTYRLRYWNLQILFSFWIPFLVATAPTVYGIETRQCKSQSHRLFIECCNSTYRLRYWNL